MPTRRGVVKKKKNNNSTSTINPGVAILLQRICALPGVKRAKPIRSKGKAKDSHIAFQIRTGDLLVKVKHGGWGGLISVFVENGTDKEELIERIRAIWKKHA